MCAFIFSCLQCEAVEACVKRGCGLVLFIYSTVVLIHLKVQGASVMDDNVKLH